MFARRLKWFIIMLSTVALIVVVRLVDIQVLRADHFQALADQLLTRPVRYLAAPRGSIRDRAGRVLVADQPTSDVSLRYEVLAALIDGRLGPDGRTYLRAVARALRKRGQFPADMPTSRIAATLEDRLAGLWPELARLTGVEPDELRRRAVAIRRRVQRVKQYIQARSPTVEQIAEEHGFHVLVRGLSDEQALAIRLQLEPQHHWLRVTPGLQRRARQADTLVHLLGRVGSASPDRIENDSLRADELRGLRPGDRCGISGVERAGELVLRGTRGRVIEDFDRTVIERLDPRRGSDVYLTIDLEVQRAVYDILAEAVDNSPHPCGGAAVVIDVATREVLALVSYPTYAYDEYRRRYDELIRDYRWMPTRFRAVSGIYPPGSTCKVIALYGGLAEGIVTPESTITCDGVFRPELPNSFRCWIYNRYRVTHGPQTASDALRNSCNIYFFTLGDRLGVDRLCRWFERFGLGRPQGTGLIEEAPGIVPTSDWLRRHRRDHRAYPADAWNFAIGQGEVAATPLQAANVAATVASGTWRPVVLLRDEAGEPIAAPAAPEQHFDQRYLSVLREGMWRVVNEPGATAYKYARIDVPGYVLCGKTGSAQAAPRPIKRRWYLEFPDGHRETVVGGLLEQDILDRYDDPKPRITGYRTCERYPLPEVDGRLPSHAWFIGFTQSRRTPRGAAPHGKVYAIAAIVEYGGSGGATAGPVVKQIAEYLLSHEE